MRAPFPFLLQTSIALVCVLFIWPLQAQTDSPRQATQAAVRYLAAASHLKVVQESECAHAVETPVDLVAILRELKTQLPPNDMAAIENIFASQDFQIRHTLEPQRLVGTMLQTFLANGMDQKTACRKISAIPEKVLQEQRENWDQARRALIR
ncbi:MAG: hypothetical protein EXR96_06365 [Nitrospiraceae bacterium]|nr:hypothetical protein [Nitrospiraceae bacterium]